MSDSPTVHSVTEPIDILLVEDNPGDVRFIREAFTASDPEYEFHVVNDGEEALDFLTQRGAFASAPPPDLVLLDLNLPKKHGISVLDGIKSDPVLRRLPVLVLTSSSSTVDISRCYEARVNAYLTKPARFDELTALVETIEEFWFGHVRLPDASD